jgi:hypothetical protein
MLSRITGKPCDAAAMTRLLIYRLLAAAAYSVAALGAVSTTRADPPVRANIAASAFSVEGHKGQVADVPGGRAFRGEAFSKLTVRTLFPVSPMGPATLLHRLAIHFRSSPSGPRLQSVEIRTGGDTEFQVTTLPQGDFAARDVTQPKGSANAWAFDPIPLHVGSTTELRLDVQYPGGFDSKVDPGTFVLTGATIDLSRKPN